MHTKVGAQTRKTNTSEAPIRLSPATAGPGIVGPTSVPPNPPLVVITESLRIRFRDAPDAMARRFGSAFIAGRRRMKNVLLAASLCTFGVGSGTMSIPPELYAANADNPYGNVDHHNDAGNDTGDSRVDQLNNGQLNGNYQGTVQPRAPSGPPGVAAVPPPPPPGMPPQPEMPPPPPGATSR